MIRRDKNGLFYAACSECKTAATKGSAVKASAAWEAEACGFAISGKFHFCRKCFLSMRERWNLFNKDLEKEEGHEGN